MHATRWDRLGRSDRVVRSDEADEEQGKLALRDRELAGRKSMETPLPASRADCFRPLVTKKVKQVTLSSSCLYERTERKNVAERKQVNIPRSSERGVRAHRWLARGESDLITSSVGWI